MQLEFVCSQVIRSDTMDGVKAQSLLQSLSPDGSASLCVDNVELKVGKKYIVTVSEVSKSKKKK